MMLIEFLAVSLAGKRITVGESKPSRNEREVVSVLREIRQLVQLDWAERGKWICFQRSSIPILFSRLLLPLLAVLTVSCTIFVCVLFCNARKRMAHCSSLSK